MSAPERSATVRGLPARIARWFIPPAVEARGREAVIRSQAILVAVAAALVTGPVTAILDLRLGLFVIGTISLLAIVLAAAIPFVLRASGSLSLAGNLTVGVLFLDLLLPGLVTLGRGPAVAFVFMVPLFAVVLCSRRAALAWTALAAAATILLTALAASPLEAAVVLPADAPSRFHRIAFVALSVSAACILTYDSMKTAALEDLADANAALRESREQFRKLIEASPDAVFVTRGQRILFVSARARDLLGASSDDQLIGRHGSEFMEATPEQLAAYERGTDSHFRAEGVRLVLRRLDGERVPVEVSASPTFFEGVPSTLSIVRDRRPEERNLARLRLLGMVVEEAHEGVVVVDSAGVVRYVNEAYARTRGLPAEELIGRTAYELGRDPAARDLFTALARKSARGGVTGGRFTTADAEAVRVWDIRVFPVSGDDPGGPVRVALVRDVSHETELEERARQSQKMEAVGQLAGGIAHDFNNHLTVILGHADELRELLPAASAAAAAVDGIVDAAGRSAALTQQLLAFARRQSVDVRVLDLPQTVRGMHDMLRRLLPERIALELAFDPDTPPVLADRGQIEQVVLNLVLNARDAIAESGRIAIAVRGGPLPEKLRDAADAADAPGACAILTVRDDGAGIEEAVRLRIFDPFFTTKAPGRGTGLGLAMVHGIVHQGGGRIDVASGPGAGTTMTVYLPAADLETLDARFTEAPRSAPAVATTGLVLLVEDDLSVRRLARRALEGAGYRVLEAGDGESALRLAQTALLDLVVTDIVMPGMSGLELADRIATTHSGVPILFVSGYAEDTVETHRLRGAGRELLGKPFRPQQLVEHARRLLAAARGFA